MSKSWWKRAAEEADLELSEDEYEDQEDTVASSRLNADNKRKMAAKEAELNALLATPFAMAGNTYSGKYPTKTGRLELPLKGE